jgi:hypothetical protein
LETKGFFVSKSLCLTTALAQTEGVALCKKQLFFLEIQEQPLALGAP